jgi:predicted DNA-binding ribbon-helix-helix protein
MTTERNDFDSPWKEIIETYFKEFIAFFFPQTHSDINWQRGYEFLDKELQKIAREAEVGRRITDKLVKVWTLAGLEVWVLIHIEVQSQYQTDFAERMYVYHYRLRDYYNHPVASFAILGDDSPTWRPNQFEIKLWGCENTFHFPIVKLLDYSQQWADLETSTNPFAIVVMAHLKTVETRNDVSSRQQWKLTLAKRLYQRDYKRQDVINLFRFIDWLIVLPEDLETVFWRDISTYQEENHMKYVMSIERIAEKRGREQGIEQGMLRERKAMILRLLTRKLGNLPTETIDQIQALSLSQLEDLLETLLELGTFEDLEDLTDWLIQLQQLKTDTLQALTQKFGPLPEALGNQIGELSLVSLTSLGSQWERLETVEALQNWVAHQVQPAAN